MKKGRKKITLSLISCIFYFLNILLYALLYHKYGKDNLGWMIWAFSHYLTFFVALSLFMGLIRSVNRKAKIINSILFTILSTASLFLGYYISVLKKGSISFFIVCTMEVLLGIALLIIEINVYIKYLRGNEVEQVENIDRKDNRVYNDYMSYFTKKEGDEKLNARVAVNLALFFSSLVYVGFLLFIIVANVFCKDIRPTHIIIVSILAFLSMSANYLKWKKINRKNHKRLLIENGSLILSFLIYLIIEWVILPVTFNIWLVTFCSIVIMPIHITQMELAKVYKENYKN